MHTSTHTRRTRGEADWRMTSIYILSGRFTIRASRASCPAVPIQHRTDTHGRRAKRTLQPTSEPYLRRQTRQLQNRITKKTRTPASAKIKTDKQTKNDPPRLLMRTCRPDSLRAGTAAASRRAARHIPPSLSSMSSACSPQPARGKGGSAHVRPCARATRC